MSHCAQVVLLSPYSGEREYELCDPSLGLLYIASALDSFQPNFTNRILDARAHKMSVADILSEVSNFKPLIVGISSTTNQFPDSLETARRIKQNFQGIKIVFGGAHVSALPETSLKHDSIDFVVKGEGEKPFHNIVDHIINQTPLKERGIFYKNSAGEVMTTGEPSRVTDLDSLPFPDFDKVPIDIYFKRQRRYAHAKDIPHLTIMTSRGCPGRCLFCSHSVYGHRPYLRGVENIIEEIERNIKKYRIKEVRIMDDMFNFDRERVIEFCKKIVAGNYQLSLALPNGIRADRVDEEMLFWMKRAGFYLIFFGIESADQNVLKKIRKGYKIEKVEKVLKLCKRMGFYTCSYFVIGLPGSTYQSEVKSVKFAVRNNLDFVGVSMCTPYPGSELFAIDKNINWSHFKHDFSKKGAIPLYVPEGRNPHDLVSSYRKFYGQFYLRPGFILSQLRHISWLSKRIPYFLSSAFRRFVKRF